MAHTIGFAKKLRKRKGTFIMIVDLCYCISRDFPGSSEMLFLDMLKIRKKYIAFNRSAGNYDSK